MNKNEIHVLGHTITTHLELDDVNRKSIVNTINPHSYCISKKDKVFEKALQASDVLLADGIGIVWAAKVLKGEKIKKIAGYDLFLYMMQQLEDTYGTCFFLGASQATLDKIHEKASKEYPNVTIHSYSPPYKLEFSPSDTEEMLGQVNKHKPQVLFMGMTAPKQEKWVFLNKEKLEANTICSIGAVFDFYAGNVKRSSPFWIKLGLEWLPRFLREPRRLAERNLVSTPKFILEVFWWKLFGKGIL